MVVKKIINKLTMVGFKAINLIQLVNDISFSKIKAIIVVEMFTDLHDIINLAILINSHVD